MKRILSLFSLLVILVCGCKNASPDEYNKIWNEPYTFTKTLKKLNDVVLENNFPPMIASRNYAYANIAAYEAMTAGNPEYISLSGQLKDMPAMPKPMVTDKTNFNFAAVLALTLVGNAVTFPEGSMMSHFDELVNMADSLGMPKDIIENSKQFADTIAQAVLKWSKKDNYSATRSAEKYSVTSEEGRYVPTPPQYGQAVEPHWGEIRPLVIDSANLFSTPPPTAYNIGSKTGVYYKALLEVKNTVDSLTEEQKAIADFWDDNPFKLNVSGHVMFATKRFSPPGHWMNIVGIGAKANNADFATTVASYTHTAIALFDGFIGCWYVKYATNYIRPETVINKHLDPNWQPYIQTPPFPSYVSGHATISAAAAEVMTHWYGDSLSFMDISLVEFGVQIYGTYFYDYSDIHFVFVGDNIQRLDSDMF